MNKIIVKTFSSPEYKYVYDRESNSIFRVSESDYLSFSNLENGCLTMKDKSVLEKFQKKGFCKESQLKYIEHPDSKYIEFYLNSKINHITLQVTQNCNLRCKYCAYSGIYNNQRVHTEKTMSFDMMKRCIDFYMENSQLNIRNSIGFYGGEPLLEFENIKRCVEYIKQNYDGRKVMYYITTNGTLLSDTIVDFLCENNFNITISLDGAKEIHNSNRVYANGKESFDDIEQNRCAMAG